MTPAHSQPTLADHPLLQECLKAHGFEAIDRRQFSNGRATVRFEGTILVAIPANSTKAWRSEIGSVPPEGVIALLTSALTEIDPGLLTESEPLDGQ